MIERCATCVGEIREQCDAALTTLRAQTEATLEGFTHDVTGREEDMVFIMTRQAQVAEQTQNQAEALEGTFNNLGCGLGPAERQLLAIETVMSGVQLFGMKAMAEAAEEEQRIEDDRIKRIQQLGQEADGVVGELLGFLDTIEGTDELPEDYFSEIRSAAANVVASGEEVSRALEETSVMGRAIDTTSHSRNKESIEDRRQAAAEAYCSKQGWDINDLDFSQEFEIRGHLRESGLLR